MNSVLMTPEMRPFVACTWARGMRLRMSTQARFAIVDRLLKDAVVRCLATGDKTVHGWAAKHGDALAFCYVPPELRRNGFATRLIGELFPGGGPRVALHPLPPWPWFLPGCHYMQDALIEVMAA